ncbi:hypothetical protein K438DRAFT_1983988 [Mycena galopus ATCC 62051]|nr:hypothetical protein K438DRAFT_1983988 [Mycena galopus ATCC 62051]
MDCPNNSSSLVSHPHALSRSSSEERPRGHAVRQASREICSTPTANDSTVQALMSAGSSSEERPSCSVKGARGSTLGGKSTASEALSKGYDTGDARTSKTELDMVVHTLLGNGGDSPPPGTPLHLEPPPSPRTPPPLFREITHPAGTPRHTTMPDEAGPSSLPPVNNAPTQTTAEQRLEKVEAQLEALLAALRSSQAAAAAATVAPPPPVVQPPPQRDINPPPLVVTPPVAASQFIPPIAPLNSPAGASLSLRSLFPDIKPACITAVITHDFEAADLYKLDARVKDAEPTYSLSAAGTFEMNMSKHRAYKSIGSILTPLHTYFAILTTHLATHTAAPAYFYRYLTHLFTLSTEYEWAAVLEYHTLFFNRRRNDMLAGSYDGWGASDIGLLSSYVYPHRKQLNLAPKGAGAKKQPPTSSSEPCRNFNAGKCESPCAWKRPHTCSAPGCGKEHPLTQHK